MGKPSVPVLTVAQHTALREAILSFSGATRSRGQYIFQSGRVGAVRTEEEGLTATVIGDTARYQTWWDLTEGEWDCECTCPVTVCCKHAYALALKILEKSVSSPAPAPRPAAAARNLSELFARARDSWDRHIVLRQTLAKPRFASIELHDPGLQHCLQEPDPEMLCWRLASRVATLTDGLLPPELEPYRDRPDLSRAYARRDQEAFGRELLAWAVNRKQPAARSLRFVWKPDLRHLRFDCSPRLTSTRLADEARSPEQLQTLLNEAQNKQGVLPVDQQLLLASYFTARERYRDTLWYGQGLPAQGVIEMLRALDGPTAWMTWDEELETDSCRRGGMLPVNRFVWPETRSASCRPPAISEAAPTSSSSVSGPTVPSARWISSSTARLVGKGRGRCSPTANSGR